MCRFLILYNRVRNLTKNVCFVIHSYFTTSLPNVCYFCYNVTIWGLDYRLSFTLNWMISIPFCFRILYTTGILFFLNNEREKREKKKCCRCWESNNKLDKHLYLSVGLKSVTLYHKPLFKSSMSIWMFWHILMVNILRFKMIHCLYPYDIQKWIYTTCWILGIFKDPEYNFHTHFEL